MDQSYTPSAMAKLKYVRMSAQKVRLVVDMVRGMQVDRALAVLRFSTRRAADPIAKTIKSAAANADDTLGLSREELYISQIFVDEGPTQKRGRFAARGRYKPIKKRSSHITVVVSARDAELAAKPKPKPGRATTAAPATTGTTPATPGLPGAAGTGAAVASAATAATPTTPAVDLPDVSEAPEVIEVMPGAEVDPTLVETSTPDADETKAPGSEE